MKAVPGRQDGIAALRQRLFFASELVKLAERELTGEAINRQGLAMACRNGAVLQLHAVLTGMLDDVAMRLRLDRAPESLTVETLVASLSARGMASPELGRISGLLESGSWLHDCHDDVRRCLSAQPEGQRDEPASDNHSHDHDHDHAHDHPHRHPHSNAEVDTNASKNPAASRPIRMIAVVAESDVEPLTTADFARIRRWIAGWKALLDEFLDTLEEF